MAENLMHTRKHHGSICSRTGVMGDRCFTLREWGLSTFLLPLPWPYELDPYSLEVHWMCKHELPTSRASTQGFRKLSSDIHIYIHKERQTDSQTDRHDRSYIPRRFAGAWSYSVCIIITSSSMRSRCCLMFLVFHRALIPACYSVICQALGCGKL